MDERLRDRLVKISHQIDRLKAVEEPWLNLKASKESEFGLLYLSTTGSVAEREAKVYTSSEWTDFSKALVQAEVQFNRERRMLDLQLKAYDAEHLSFKIDHSAIARQGSQV
jgi:hypothetical protein